MNRLKEFRCAQKLSQKKVSELANINIRLYQYYEADTREPLVHTAIRLARALGTTVEELFPLEEK